MRHVVCAFVGSLVLLSVVPQSRAADQVLIGGNFAVDVINNIPYYEGKDADPRKHKLDLFLPKNHKDFPVLVFIHGGGWSSGDRKLYGNVGSIFAKNGIGTAVISYRLSPGVKHPGHIQDVARAFAWTYKNIGKYGGRIDQIFVTGQSAGGHLTALLATNERYLRAENLSLKAIKGAIPISGIYRFAPGRMAWMLGDDDQAIATASPVKNVSGNEPPFLILYASKDFPSCDKMSNEMCAALKQKKVEVTVQEIADRTHVSIMFRMMLNEADPTTQAVLKFIAKHSGMTLKPRNVKD